MLLCIKFNDHSHTGHSTNTMQNPNEDTEWNSILRSKGILPQKNEATLDEDTLVQVSLVL